MIKYKKYTRENTQSLNLYIQENNREYNLINVINAHHGSKIE
jgi:hypothetical protein